MKLFVVFGFILVAIILTFSVVFTQGMYQAAAQESNNTLEAGNETITQYQTDYSWAMFISVLAVIFVIALVFALFLT